MKVKIGELFYDANEVPIMVILTEKDKENIKNMHPEANRYCSYPKGLNRKWIAKWMDEY